MADYTSKMQFWKDAYEGANKTQSPYYQWRQGANNIETFKQRILANFGDPFAESAPAGGGAPAPGPAPGMGVSGNVTIGGGIGGGPNADAMVGMYRDIADPFWNQRAGYQTKLADLLKNPGEMTSSPMYQFAMDQGMDAVNRTAAAKGLLGSGNRLADLTKFGQGLASQQFFPMAELLSKLSGAGIDGGGAALGGLVNTRGQDLDFASSLARTNALGNEGYWNYMATKDTNASNKSLLQLQQELEERNKLFDENQRRDVGDYNQQKTWEATARAMNRNKMPAI